MTKYQKAFYDIKNFGDYDVVGEDIDYKVIVDNEAKEVILQFEESDSREDWKHNFMFLPWLLKLDGKYVITTHGYACAYKSACDLPLNEFCKAVEEHKDYSKTIRGWSFGSAMAKIALRHYYIRNKEAVDECYTYGDVKCWLNPFIHILSDKYAVLIHNFVTANDFVTWQVPFYWRMNKAKTGAGFKLKEILKTEYYHTHYEEYDYSDYE